MDEPGDRAALEASAAQFQQTVEASPFFGYGWFILGELRERLGEKDAAIAAYRRARELDPSDPFGAIVRLGRLGAEGPVSMPEGFVRSMFDRYAPRFDIELVEGLSYRAPALLREAIVKACEEQGRAMRFRAMLDLGCGTGLAGAAFRPHVEAMTGVDLSDQMLAIARAKDIYRRLEAQEIVRFLDADEQGSYDLIIAADALPYFDDLNAVVAAAARRLELGGLFGFTVETYAGNGVVLGEKLRFAHGASYVRDGLGAAGLVLLDLSETTTRTEAGQPVPGLLAVAMRP